MSKEEDDKRVGSEGHVVEFITADLGHMKTELVTIVSVLGNGKYKVKRKNNELIDINVKGGYQGLRVPGSLPPFGWIRMGGRTRRTKSQSKRRTKSQSKRRTKSLSKRRTKSQSKRRTKSRSRK